MNPWTIWSWGRAAIRVPTGKSTFWRPCCAELIPDAPDFKGDGSGRLRGRRLVDERVESPNIECPDRRCSLPLLFCHDDLAEPVSAWMRLGMMLSDFR